MYTFNASALQRARARRGLTREQLAERVGMPVEELALWERGRVDPIGKFLRICNVLSVAHADLIKGVSEDDPDAIYFGKQTGSISTALYDLMSEDHLGEMFTAKQWTELVIRYTKRDVGRAAVTSALRRMVIAKECDRNDRYYGIPDQEVSSSEP